MHSTFAGVQQTYAMQAYASWSTVQFQLEQMSFDLTLNKLINHDKMIRSTLEQNKGAQNSMDSYLFHIKLGAHLLSFTTSLAYQVGEYINLTIVQSAME